MKRLLNTLYLTNPDAYLRKKDDALAVYVEQKKVMSVPFHLLEGVVLFGHVGCSTAVLGACATRGISVAILDEGGRFQASVRGPISGNVLLRREQYRRSMDVPSAFRLQGDSLRQRCTTRGWCFSTMCVTTPIWKESEPGMLSEN